MDYKNYIIAIADHDKSGNLIARWAELKLSAFNRFVRRNRDALVENGDVVGLVADITDFYLRVIEDGATYSEDFRSGEDDRIRHYLSIGAAVLDAPNDEIGLKILGCTG